MGQATVLIVEDDVSLREALTDTLALSGYRVMTAVDGQSALDRLQNDMADVVVCDVQMEPMDGLTLLKRVKAKYQELPVILMTAYGTIQKAVEAMREGAADYLVKPFDATVLVNTLERYENQMSLPDDEPVSQDSRMKEIIGLAARVAKTDATVMITGESGTGKEVLARYIHRLSKRIDQPFVAINCAAIPENMLEAVLFGYEKGAFTGAYQACPGKFEQAQGGTLLLDEISEMNLGLQAKLLRVLQEKEVERLGGRKVIPLDVRVIATSNRQMREEVAAGRFREDLFYRLNVFPLHIPALRARRNDILPLAWQLIRRHCVGRELAELTEETELHLMNHDWPGNVRELDNVIQRALILMSGNRITPDELQFEHVNFEEKIEATSAGRADDDENSLDAGLKVREQHLIVEALKAGNGSRKLAAERLGISQRTLRYKLARLREAGVEIPG